MTENAIREQSADPARDPAIKADGNTGREAGSGPVTGPPTTPGAPESADVLEALRDVVDPELGINVVDLGLVYGVELDDDGAATIDMTLTSAACPLTDVIEDQAAEALEGLVSGFRINWVWLPPWGPDKITDEGREELRALGFNV